MIRSRSAILPYTIGIKKATSIAFFMLLTLAAYGQADTVRIMAYNVLYYGDRPACQGPHSVYHNYLKTIVAYCSPDILGLEKVAAFPLYTGDNSGSAPAGFADSILRFALDPAFAGRYAYCSYTNASGADNMSLLYYDRNKFGFAGIVASYVNLTDFNTYKLYYKTSRLILGDTVFLYVTLNHTQSGNSATTRNAQLAGEMSQLAGLFTTLPNLVNMGDFNFHNSSESGYQNLIAPGNPAFTFSDPPFSVDGTYAYPADWDNHPENYPACLTTSTRSSSSVPNSCGTSGGGKSWYDHIFLSPSLIDGSLRMRYITNTYRTIGNDGNRVGVSVNDAPANTAAPAAVIEALFQMSNKYPVMVSMQVDTAASASINDLDALPAFTLSAPVTNKLDIAINNPANGGQLRLVCTDMLGRILVQYAIGTSEQNVTIPFTAPPGVYSLTLYNSNGTAQKMLFSK